ncbi:MAG: glycosyltransferase family 4 protein [Actinobacteria bacterium]|nr:glycosyltransferase family 4 protein [Actinomycetota bacterium]MBU4358470.1 glycosyltransferase family 4 protein [Actinomycetota bacterium]MBU4392487.1 glycosyltransferase family 4 protein [Actinomycetota bacterium]MBU4441533.1 glycosyltransferase family 4 protein [Actinomycetota bacterium]MCG2818232.1 glycosyltransferase family 4 protein [Actinomycetes bacterium]
MSEKSLSVAQIHWGFPPTIGGVETHLSIMCPEMVRLGHKISVLTASIEGESDRVEYKGVQVYRSPVMDLNRFIGTNSTFSGDEVEKAFVNFLDETKPDIIHAHNLHYFTRIHTEVLDAETRRRGIPLMLTAHNMWDEGICLDLTARFPWDHIIAVSHFIKKELMGAGVEDEKITVVHHGIDTDKFKKVKDLEPLYQKYPNCRGRRVIFHPARISLGKGGDISVKAAALVKRRFPDILLVLAGLARKIDWDEAMPGDMAFISELVKIHGMQDNLYIDTFSIDQMAELYNLAEICVYPSTAYEPFGLTMLEAQASEKPIVVTRIGGMPEIIHDGINGYVVPARDHEALAHRIIILLQDDRLKRRFGTVGRQNVLTHFTKQIMTKRVLEIYGKVLNRQSATSI